MTNSLPWKIAIKKNHEFHRLSTTNQTFSILKSISSQLGHLGGSNLGPNCWLQRPWDVYPTRLFGKSPYQWRFVWWENQPLCHWKWWYLLKMGKSWKILEMGDFGLPRSIPRWQIFNFKRPQKWHFLGLSAYYQARNCITRSRSKFGWNELVASVGRHFWSLFTSKT